MTRQDHRQPEARVLRRPVGTRARSALNTRQHMWEVMCELSKDGPFTIPEVAANCNSVAKSTIRQYLRALHAAGYAKRLNGEGESKTKAWLIVKPGAKAPRLRADGTPSREWRGQQQLWNAMRRLHSFDFAELAAVASTDDCHVSPATAQRYLGLLRRGGYLAEVEPPGPGRRGRYRLRTNTGPRAPRIVRALHDPNTGEIIIGEEKA